MMSRCTMGTALIALCLVVLPSVSALRFVIDREECLQQKVKEHERVVGSFVVFDFDSPWRDSGALIDLDITDPSGNIVLSRHQSTDERFSFTAETAGVYRFCLRNKMGVPETVEFSLGESEDEDDEEPAELAQDSHVQDVLQTVRSIRTQLGSLQMDQVYFNSREARRRKTNESTSWRVMIYAIVEAGVLVGASGLQVYILRRLFERKGAYNKRGL